MPLRRRDPTNRFRAGASLKLALGFCNRRFQFGRHGNRDEGANGGGRSPGLREPAIFRFQICDLSSEFFSRQSMPQRRLQQPIPFLARQMHIDRFG